jgi:hypothetical protein
MDRDEKPAVLITDFKILVSSGNTNAVASGSSNSPGTSTPAKRRYGPKLSGVFTSPASPRDVAAEQVVGELRRLLCQEGSQIL